MDPLSTLPLPPLPTENNLGRATSRNADEATALRSFEAYFVGEMLKRSAPQDPTGLFDGGEAGRMYQEHLYQELARIVAEKGDFGVASSLKGALSKKDNVAPGSGQSSEPVSKPLPNTTPAPLRAPALALVRAAEEVQSKELATEELER